MLSLKLAWVLFLLPLPWVTTRWLAEANPERSGLYVPLLDRSLKGKSAPPTPFGVDRLVLWFFWVCLVLAATNPVWVGEPSHRSVNGRDLMLAIDVSGSMQESDMMAGEVANSRIDVLKAVISEFIERREGDRLGLVLFGSRAYSYVPLTFDRRALNELLDGVSTGLAGRLTAMGDAIGIAYRTLSEQDARHKVLILVTDGSNTEGTTDPLAAARIAARNGMTIYTIGIGNDAETMRELVQQNNLPPGTVLNEKLLQEIAAVSSGVYFRARNTSSLTRIYRTLDTLEPVALELRRHRPETTLFQIPLALAVIVLLIFLGYRSKDFKFPGRTL